MRNLCSIFIYPFVFWSAVSLGVLALPGSLHCINPVVGLIQGTGKLFLTEGAGKKQKSQRKLSLAKTVIQLLLTSSYKKHLGRGMSKAFSKSSEETCVIYHFSHPGNPPYPYSFTGQQARVIL